MSRGKNLQEMEMGTKQSKSAVNANAKPAEPMPKLTTGIPDGQTGNWEDLGGPTPDNYRPDDSSAELKDAGSGLKQVRDVVNKSAKAADPMRSMPSPLKEDEEEYDEDEYIEEEADDEDEEELEDSDYDEDDEELEDNEELEDDEELEEDFDIDEDIEALIGGEELSEEFKEKTKTIFEAALRSRVSYIREELEAAYEERLIEEVEEMKQTLEDRVDSYLEYVAEEWIQENALAVEYGIKEELSESFLSGMKNLFEEHYVQLPEEKYDVLESMVEKLDEMETKLNEQIEKNISLNNRLSESVAVRIFDYVSEGLATTQKEKLASLAESVEFESEREYREKLEILRESFFPTKTTTPITQPETLSEGVYNLTESYSGSMESYLKAASLLANN
jgi:hypothetical protein